MTTSLRVPDECDAPACHTRPTIVESSSDALTFWCDVHAEQRRLYRDHPGRARVKR